MPEKTVKIVKGLWQVGGPGLTASEDAAIYLLRQGPEAALVDAGTGKACVILVDNIRSVLPPEVTVRHLFLTHCHYDHSGGAPALKKAFGCSIITHEKDAFFLERGDSRVTAASWYGATIPKISVDYQISGDEESFPVGSGIMAAVHAPGHSPGSTVFWITIDGKKVLFGQDVHGPLHPALLSDKDQYANSLQRMLEIKADILCEGHFGIIRGKQEVKNFIANYMPGR